MPGDEWQRFANARAFISYMYGHPGKKLLFMGSEIGQTAEWNSEGEVEWWLLDYEIHRQFQTFCASLNQVYRSEPAMYEIDFQGWGFEWIDFHDSDNSIIAFVRRAKDSDNFLIFACNFTPTPHQGYRIGVPEAGGYREIFNSDAAIFGGSNMGNGGYVESQQVPSHGRAVSVELTIPPLAVLILKPERQIRKS
jgi:1,4-alpha-glucan branching enzyme